jgi:hypothetical protein
VAWITTACWQTNKPLPPGVGVESSWYAVSAQDVSFIADITSSDAYGRPVSSQAIFDEVLKVVRSAREFLVLDWYLFNPGDATADGAPTTARALSGEIRDALLERRRKLPSLKVLLIIDPVNALHGAAASTDVRLLRAAGVEVVFTDLDRLRDPNFLYSSFWRLGLRWWTHDTGGAGWLPNPTEESSTPVTFGTWARLLNFKGNQRNVVIGDDGRGGLVGIVTSASAHDASSAHSNVAAKIAGAAVGPLLASELDIARFSGWAGNLDPPGLSPTVEAVSAQNELTSGHSARVRVLTEGAIRRALLEELDATSRGDSIDIAMLYLADRGVIESLLAAARRGVNVRLILDPNGEAFGQTKTGIPNQPAATELASASDGAVHVRWYRTHGEQFHSKLVMVYGPQRLWMTLGSASLTRRNLGDYNLEANVAIEVSRSSPLALQTLDYFETLWTNRASLGIEYTTDFAAHSDPAQSHYWLYRVMAGTGASTF